MALYIRNVAHKGRGVFSDTAIEEGQLIECCPVILIANANETYWLKETQLANYLFNWGTATTPQSALALGYGSLYNHSQNANACYRVQNETGFLAFYSLRLIKADEEITIHYGNEPGSSHLSWFEQRNIRYVE